MALSPVARAAWICALLASLHVLIGTSSAADIPRRPRSRLEINQGVRLVYQRIEALLAQDPVDWDAVVREYEVMFGAYGETEDGRAALLEVARIERERGHFDKAGLACRQLAQFFPKGTLLSNFWVGGGPIDLEMTALIELSRTLAASGDELGALSVLDDQALRFSESVVGSPYAPEPWYGPVQVERCLLRAPILMRLGKGTEAVDSLLYALEQYGDQPRMSRGVTTSSSQALLEGIEVLLVSDAMEPSRLYMVLDRAQAAVNDEPGAARALLLRGSALAAQAHRESHRGLFIEAEEIFKRSAIEQGGIEVQTSDGPVPAGVLAVRRLAGLASTGFEPNQVAMQLELIAKDGGAGRAVAGHAWLCYSDLMEQMGNPNQAMYALTIIIRNYADVPAYAAGDLSCTLGREASERIDRLAGRAPEPR